MKDLTIRGRLTVLVSLVLAVALGVAAVVYRDGAGWWLQALAAVLFLAFAGFSYRSRENRR